MNRQSMSFLRTTLVGTSLGNSASRPRTKFDERAELSVAEKQTELLTEQKVRDMKLGDLLNLVTNLCGADSPLLEWDKKELVDFFVEEIEKARSVGVTMVADEIQNALVDYQRRLDLIKDLAKKFRGLLSPETLQRDLPFRDEYIESADYLNQNIKKEIKIMVLGENSCGKSMLLNLILCENLLPSYTAPATVSVCEISYSKTRSAKTKDNAVVKDLSLGNSSDILDEWFKTFHRDRVTPDIEIFCPSRLLEKNLILVDTPGLGENEVLDDIVKNYLDTCDGIIFVMQPHNGIKGTMTGSMFSIANNFEGKKKSSTLSEESFFFIVNKWDLLDNEDDKKLVGKGLADTIGKIFPGYIKENLFTMDSKAAHNHFSQLGNLNENHRQLHAQIARYVTRICSARISSLLATLTTQIQTTLAFIQKKLRTAGMQEKEKVIELKKMDDIIRDLEHFKKFKDIEKKAEGKFEELVTEIYNKGHKDLKIQVGNVAAGANRLNSNVFFPRVKEALDDLFRNRLDNFVLEGEGLSTSLAAIKRELVEELKIVSGEFFSKLSEVDAGAKETNRIYGYKRTHVYLAVGLGFPLLLPAALFALPVVLSMKAIKEHGIEEDFNKTYSNNPADWRRKYANIYFDSVFTRRFLVERVESKLFSPAFYIKNLKDTIGSVLSGEREKLRILRNEDRSEATIRKTFEPMSKALSELLTDVGKI